MIKLDLIDSVFISKVLGKLKYKLLSELKDDNAATKLDIAIYKFYSGGELAELECEINRLLNFIDNEHWQIILKNIHELFDAYLNLPKELLDYNLRLDLVYLYNQEFYRLFNLVDSEEFRLILGVNQVTFQNLKLQNSNFPNHLQELGEKWTVGQAEEFNLVLKLASIKEGNREHILAEELKKEPKTSATTMTTSFYDFEDLYMANQNWTNQQRNQVAEYLKKSLDLVQEIKVPVISLFIGEFYFNKKKNIAKDYFEKTKLDLENKDPNELYGNPVYISSLIHLAYLYLKENKDLLKVNDLLEKAYKNRALYEDDIGVKAFDSFRKGSVAFMKWFNENKNEISFWSV